MIQQCNDIFLFYEKNGAGAPLLLLHGNGETHHIFDALAKKLAHHYTVYAIDSRNHGESTKTQDFSYQLMVNDILQFIEANALGAVQIVGFSDGAIIALMLAMQCPNAITKMALLGVNLSPADFTQDSMAYLQQAFAETKDPLLRLMLEEPNIALEDVTCVQTPTLLIAGDHDIFKPETFTQLQEALPHASLQIMHGHDHDSYVNGTDLLYDDLRAFFA